MNEKITHWDVQAYGDIVDSATIKVDDITYQLNIFKCEGKIFHELWQDHICVSFAEAFD